MDAIVCVSAFLMEQVRARFPARRDRIHHIPFGVEIPSVTATSSNAHMCSEMLEVIYCGRLAHEQKRIGDLAQIILSCQARNLPIRFHIAGSGPDEEEFFERIGSPLGTGRVVRHGLIPNDRVGALLQQCHVFILTSAYEGLPVSLLEAMAAGCVPVVTAVASGISEVITDGVEGYIHPIGDLESMINRLAVLAASPVMVATHSRRALERVVTGGFTSEVCVRRYLDLCECLGNQPKAGGSRHRHEPELPPRYRIMNRLNARLSSFFKRH